MSEDYSAMEDHELLNALGDNAALWAAAFRQTAVKLGYSDMDEGWLIGWFANAIEHSSHIRTRDAEPGLPTLEEIEAMTGITAGIRGVAPPISPSDTSP